MEQIEKKMNTAISHFEKELNSLRTSRANPSMLDNITDGCIWCKNSIKSTW